MGKTPLELPFEAFDSASWKKRIEKELKGKSFNDHLIWDSLDGFEIEAWQDRLPNPLPTPPALSSPWKIVEPVYNEDAQEANLLALDALMKGAEAIWFEKGFLGAAAEVASKNIDQEIAPVFINGGNCIDPFKGLLKSGEKLETPTEVRVLLNGIRLRERGASVVDEVALLLSQAIEIGFGEEHEQHFIFKSGIGTSYLTEIAKLRALRWLWAGILKEQNQVVQNPTILAVNLAQTYAMNDEHSNILRATSSALSAAIGGAEFIMIEPWDKRWKDQHGFSARISRNIQVLMKEEGRLDKNMNPADGSYFIENLTLRIARKAWEKVLKIQSEGGFSAYAQSAKLKAALDKHRQELLNAYLTEHRTLLGVNKYQPANLESEREPRNESYDHLPEHLFLPFEIQKQVS